MGGNDVIFIPTQLQQPRSTLLAMKLAVLVLAIATVLATVKATPGNIRREQSCSDYKTEEECEDDVNCEWVYRYSVCDVRDYNSR